VLAVALPPPPPEPVASVVVCATGAASTEPAVLPHGAVLLGCGPCLPAVLPPAVCAVVPAGGATLVAALPGA
jgi:hypothetical protein